MRLGKGLLRFDKACLLAKSLEMTFAGAMGERSLPMINVRKHLVLRPAVYVLRDWKNGNFSSSIRDGSMRTNGACSAA